MEVILKEDVPKLGTRGEVVKVAEGYGRNFLLPKKLAIEATSANKTVIEQMKAASCGAPPRKRRSRSAGQAVRRTRSQVPAQVRRRRSLVRIGHGRDIADALEKKSFHIDRRRSSCTIA